jgi:RNA polymerase sigma factor (sigma-70 family)
MPSCPDCPEKPAPQPVPPPPGPVDWEQLVRRHGRRLRRQLTRQLPRLGVYDSEAAGDAVQEVWLRLFTQGTDTLRQVLAEGEGAARSYLYCVGYRVLLDQVRFRDAAKRGRRGPLCDGRGLTPLLEDLVDLSPNPEVRLLRRERRRALFEQFRRFANRAPVRAQRGRNLAILLRAFFAGWSSREIAAAEGRLAPSSVDSLLHRARRQLAARGFRLPSRCSIRVLDYHRRP